MNLRQSSPVTKGRKFKQVLAGARKVFLRDGFAGASVDDIAREAGVSKATLYSYFPDKQLMFSEVFRAELALGADEPMVGVSADRPAGEGLPLMLQDIARRMVSAEAVRSYRIGVAESARFPELALEYHELVHKRRCQEVRHYLERWVRRGELEVEDLGLAAEQLIALAAVMLRDQALFLGQDKISEAVIRRMTQGSAQMFMATYGTSGFGGAHSVPGQGSLGRQDRAKTVPPLD